MRFRCGAGIRQTVRQYSVALGFVLGQIDPLPTTPLKPQAAIVRTQPDQRDAQGFDPRECVSPRQVLTVPHRLVSDMMGQAQVTDGTARGESDWLRRN